ncbi:MAG: hypothetical protein M3Y50_07070, partial [Acidobacteriota bacterium]|nr:hypothetical protein [Acidobacteriota bacterium]
IKVVTQSGTNDLHGSLFFLYDEPGLNAYAKYGGPDGQKPLRVANKQRTYDASLGGPILKDKLFGFASFAGFGLSANTTATQFVETPQYRSQVVAARQGSIAATILNSAGVTPRVLNILPIDCSIYANNQGMYKPQNGVMQTAAGGPYCNPVAGGLDIGSPTAGGTSQIGVYVPSFSAATANYVGGGLDGTADVEYAQLLVPVHARGRQFNGRIDWYASQKNQFAGSFYITKLDNYGVSGTTDSRPQSDIPFKPLNTAATLIYIHTFSANWLNELRGNGTRFADNGIRDGGGVINFGIPYINIQGLPFSNNVQYGVQQSSSSPAVFAENTFEVRDQVTHTWGAHTLRFGGSVEIEQDNDNLSGNTRPVYAVQGLWNFANDAPIFEGISASTVTGGPTNSQLYLRSKDIAGYVQHDWKLSSTFTLNTGFRYEIFTPISNKGGNIGKPVLGPAGSELSGLRMAPTHDLYNTDYGHYAPKVGFAWVPAFYDGNIVFRGGFAVAYNHLDAALFNSQALDNSPGAANFNICCGTSALDFGTPLAGGLIQYSTGASNSPTSFPPNPGLATGINSNGFPTSGAQVEVYGVGGRIRNPVSYLYSLETQTQFPYKIVTTVGFGGSLGRHLPRLVNQNFLYDNTKSPVYASYFAQTDSIQAYNSLNVRVSRQLQRGFLIEGFYRFAKNMDQVSNGDGPNSNGNQTNPANNRTEYGPSDYDTRNLVTISGLYTSPRVHASNFLLKAAANGWQINGIFTAHSGFPYTPVTYNLQTTGVQGAAVVGPTRPLGILSAAGPIGNSCSNSAFISGSNFSNRGPLGTAGGSNYFDTTKPTLAPGQNYVYVPGIGRNSFVGPCYRDIDMSLAKQVEFEAMDHTATLRFQANFFNTFNFLNLQPIQNGNADPAANIQNKDFGKADNADAGRQIEFLLRLNF